MARCSLCGGTFKAGQYVEVDGKNACFGCVRKNKGKVQKALQKQSPKIISCPYCSERYPLRDKRCPKCGSLSPLYDFHFGDLLANVTVGLIVVILPVIIVVSLVTWDRWILLANLIGLPFLIVGLVFELVFLALFYYIGLLTRDLCAKGKAKKAAKKKK